MSSHDSTGFQISLAQLKASEGIVMTEDHIYHFHLVSDASGETIRSVARACLVQFEDITKVEHTWSLVRSRRQIAEIVQGIEEHIWNV